MHIMTNRTTYHNERRAQARAEWIATNGPCQHCGSSEHLEVDHVDPELKTVGRHSNIWGWSAERRTAELTKCQVLCRTCHKRKTAAWQSATRTGNDNPNSKLTSDDVRAIRSAYPRKSYRQLASEYGVSHITIYYAVSKNRWKSVL